MVDNLSAQSLIHYFEDKLSKMDNLNLGTIGKEPQYPMLVVFLGKDSYNGYATVANGLFRLWPQYQEELQFISVIKDKKNIRFAHIVEEQERYVQKPVRSDEVSKIVTSLFGIKKHFRDRSRLFVYYILDTEGFKDIDDYDDWVNVIERTRAFLGVDETDILDMLIVILNESFSTRKISNKIKNRLYQYSLAKEGSFSSVLLLSNRRSDDAILEDLENCYRIAASIMALSNNSDTVIGNQFFERRIITASYAREEKPIGEIAQVVVKSLVDELEKYNLDDDGKYESDTIMEELGVTEDGTIGIINDYVDKVLKPMLPTKEQLNLFPRKNIQEYDDISGLSANEFNEVTMNSWNYFLEQILQDAANKVISSSNLRKDLGWKYKELLQRNFTNNQLVFLMEHKDDIQKKFLEKKQIVKNMDILGEALLRFKYKLSSDSKFIDIFMDEIESEGKEAKVFLDGWKHLRKSSISICPVRDGNLAMFYEKKTRDYFDIHGEAMKDEFRKIKKNSELRKFMEDTLDKIIESDSAFSSNFEEELEHRLQGGGFLEDANDAKQYIRQKLIHDDVYTYYQGNFNLGEPILRTIMLRSGTDLYKSLGEHLDSDTYYYNTASGNVAEAVSIYEVKGENLINGEGERTNDLQVYS